MSRFSYQLRRTLVTTPAGLSSPTSTRPLRFRSSTAVVQAVAVRVGPVGIGQRAADLVRARGVEVVARMLPVVGGVVDRRIAVANEVGPAVAVGVGSGVRAAQRRAPAELEAVRQVVAVGVGHHGSVRPRITHMCTSPLFQVSGLVSGRFCAWSQTCHRARRCPNRPESSRSTIWRRITRVVRWLEPSTVAGLPSESMLATSV
jgi:hypothetical protein